MRNLLAGLFAVWRNTVGLVVPDACRFRPTCSRYAAEAVLRRGAIIGLGLTAWRLARCHPFSKGGYDPVIRSSPPCKADSD